MAEGYRVARVAVPPEPLLGGASYDYADAFEIELDRADAHTAQEWVRAALEQASPGVRGLIRFVHGRVARFELNREPDSILGWETVSSMTDVLHLRAAGPLLRAHIVARRRSETSAVVTTFLQYEGRVAPLLWVVVGPLHRRVAPYLLRRAAATLTAAATT